MNLYSFECTGTENNILECAYDRNMSNCSIPDAGVLCIGNYSITILRIYVEIHLSRVSVVYEVREKLGVLIYILPLTFYKLNSD